MGDFCIFTYEYVFLICYYDGTGCMCFRKILWNIVKKFKGSSGKIQ